MSGKPIEQIRRDFWEFFLANTNVVEEKPKFDSNLWVSMKPYEEIVLSLGIRQSGGATVFLRGRIDAPLDTAGPVLEPHQDELRRKLLTGFKHESDANAPYYFRKANPKADFTLPSRWPLITEWFDKSVQRYQFVLQDVLG